MKLSHQDYEHFCVLTLSGEFTIEDIEPFRRLAEDRLAGGARHLMLDCEHLEFVDSAALETMLTMRDDLASRGGQMRLINPDDTVRTILELTRLDRAFESHATIEAAVRSVR